MPSIEQLAAALERGGASLTVRRPGRPPLRIGPRPDAAIVTLHDAEAERLLHRADQLSLAAAYVDGHLDVEGDFDQVLGVTQAWPEHPAWHRLLWQWMRLHLPGRARWARNAIGFHYDRPPEFFLPWFERWRSYSHGLYETPADAPEEAQRRKLATALAALGLEAGMTVLDIGAGWGAFLEFAGLRGVRVEGITISKVQERFLADLIRMRELPCTVRRVDLRDFRPARRYDGAVLMGSLEHLPDYGRVARFLARHLEPRARVWADFCAQRGRQPFGDFIASRVWPGPTRAVDVGALVRSLTNRGFVVEELSDDTNSYSYTVRDWADALDAAASELAGRFGEPAVRTFRILLRTSARDFSHGRLQAYHLVARRVPGAAAA